MTSHEGPIDDTGMGTLMLFLAVICLAIAFGAAILGYTELATEFAGIGQMTFVLAVLGFIFTLSAHIWRSRKARQKPADHRSADKPNRPNANKEP